MSGGKKLIIFSGSVFFFFVFLHHLYDFFYLVEDYERSPMPEESEQWFLYTYLFIYLFFSFGENGGASRCLVGG